MMRKNVYSAIIYGWLLIFLIILGTSMVLALFLRFTPIEESQLSWLTLALGLLALFIGGIFAGIKGKTKGWFIGLGIGLGFTLLIFFIQYLGYKQAFTIEQFLYHLAYLIAAIFGSILGVNFVKAN